MATVSIITKTADSVTRELTTVTGEWTDREITGTLLDAMIDAQDTLGQINWTALDQVTARGYHTDRNYVTTRVAVIDTENADGRAVLDLVSWLRDTE